MQNILGASACFRCFYAAHVRCCSVTEKDEREKEKEEREREKRKEKGKKERKKL